MTTTFSYEDHTVPPPTFAETPRSTSLIRSRSFFNSPSTTMTVTPISCKPLLIYSFKKSYIRRVVCDYC